MFWKTMVEPTESVSGMGLETDLLVVLGVEEAVESCGGSDSWMTETSSM